MADRNCTGRQRATHCATAEQAALARIVTIDGEVGVARFTTGDAVLVAQDAKATVLLGVTVEQARQIAVALVGGAA